MITIFDYSLLKGRITQLYNSQSGLAKAIGKSDTYVSLVLNGKAFLSQKEIEEWADALEIGIKEIGAFFFAHEVHEMEQEHGD